MVWGFEASLAISQNLVSNKEAAQVWTSRCREDQGTQVWLGGPLETGAIVCGCPAVLRR